MAQSGEQYWDWLQEETYRSWNISLGMDAETESKQASAFSAGPPIRSAKSWFL